MLFSLSAFKIFFFILGFMQLDYDVSGLDFFFFNLSCLTFSELVSVNVCFQIKFRNLLAITSLNFFLHQYFAAFGTPVLNYFILSH